MNNLTAKEHLVERLVQTGAIDIREAMLLLDNPVSVPAVSSLPYQCNTLKRTNDYIGGPHFMKMNFPDLIGEDGQLKIRQ